MESIANALEDEKRAYAHGANRPLGPYLGTLGAYAGAVGGLMLAAKLLGRRPPTVKLGDLALMTVATHKISRTITKDPVMSPLRAPFTRYKGTSGPAELAEEPRTEEGKTKHALGELVVCPFCTAQWVATAYVAGLTFAPQLTRLAGATMTAVAGSDWLQLAYARLQQAAEG
ncbi:DUF1360 domain-containing protein [Actinomadura scrupuli]|uniref:DUF1360 domain-containing protein n=1 Tax=Actinomadura scrupuli TaxID=559629 RepID=UPI003D98D145